MVIHGQPEGNHEIFAVLAREVESGRIAHAYLFTGPAAVTGAAAGSFAAALLCDRPGRGRACGECRPCRQLQHGNHPDLLRVAPSGATIKIDQVRQLLRLVQYRSYQGGRKVFLLGPAEAMTGEAANCLLKTLEEPPEDNVFILMSERPDFCLPTILSRCRRIAFREARPEPEDSPLSTAAADLARRICGAGPAGALALAEEVAARENVPALLAGLTRLYRDLFVRHMTGEGGLLFYPGLLLDRAGEPFPRDPAKLVECIEALEAAGRRLDRNSNKRLVLEVLFLNLAGVTENAGREKTLISRDFSL
ncbi:MAG: DNA polymerase III subunit delta' [Firmicutes bacterium]|nr:DNA polymerase III subunit delta' [Bacillota bacterium]